MSYKVHIFSCVIILVSHVNYSDIHVYILLITNNFHLPRAFAWCGALSSDCEIYTAINMLKSLFFLSNIISVLHITLCLCPRNPLDIKKLSCSSYFCRSEYKITPSTPEHRNVVYKVKEGWSQYHPNDPVSCWKKPIN